VSIKDQVLAAINRLPQDADFGDVVEEVAFLAAIQEAEDDIREGRIVLHDQMKARLQTWLKR